MRASLLLIMCCTLSSCKELTKDSPREKSFIVSRTERPGEYGSPIIQVPPRQANQGAREMFRFGELDVDIRGSATVNVNATVTFRPVNYQPSAVGAAFTAEKGDELIVLSSSNAPNGALERGSGDGSYFKPSADGYSTVPVIGTVKLPSKGVWTIKILIENSSTDDTQLTVHTYSVSAIVLPD